MNHQFDHELQSLLSGSLHDRASRADTHGRGFADVRRRVRRRRQRQTALALLPTAAGIGWFVSQPAADDPLRPADGASGLTTCDTGVAAETTSPVSTIVSTTYLEPYEVQEGDSWNKIAEMYGPDVQLLLLVNGRSGEDPNTPAGAAGETIVIPTDVSLPNAVTNSLPPESPTTSVTESVPTDDCATVGPDTSVVEGTTGLPIDTSTTSIG